MDITPIIGRSRQVITGYGDGGFSINHERLEGSLIVFADSSLAWGVKAADELTREHLSFILHAEPPIELLLIGTGGSMQMLAPEIKALLKAKHIACEIMDTGAACRTYNVLLSEERRVAAALIAV